MGPQKSVFVCTYERASAKQCRQVIIFFGESLYVIQKSSRMSCWNTLTEFFIIVEPQNLEMCELFVGSADSKALDF